jgi:putative hydrolase of the HAD superfamily
MHAVIFDFGNVIGFFDYGIAFERIAQAANPSVSPDAVREACIGSGRARRLESGDLPSSQFLQEIKQVLHLQEVDEATLALMWSDIFARNNAVADVIHRLPASLRLILGSNTNDLHFQHFCQQFKSEFAHFSDFVLSYEIKHMKPDREFFEACLAKAQCAPFDCFYIDDVPDYVQFARSMGIDGLVYQPTVDLSAEFARRGITM